MTSYSVIFNYPAIELQKLTLFLILCTLLSWSNAGLATLTEGEPCTIQKLPGRCTASSKCTSLKTVIRNGQINADDIPSCGFNPYEEMICCPIIAQQTFTSLPAERPAVRACREIEKNAAVPLETHVSEGIPAEPGEFPHIGALGYPGTGKGEKYSFRCGASLIAPRFLLTAAHCINSLEDVLIPKIVRLGTVNIKNVGSSAVDMDIKELHVYPNFTSVYDDIGLVELHEPVPENLFISMVCLHTTHDVIPMNARYFVTGWGFINKERDATEILIKAELSIVPKPLCSDTFEKENSFRSGRLEHGITDGLVCAHDTKTHADACQGDSGGPLNLLLDPVRKLYRVFGIVSTGYNCGGAVPGLYTRVSNYLDYIERIVWPTG